jgi:four helix bundle protein
VGSEISLGMSGKKKVVSFQDLDVYQRAYKAALVISEKIIPFLRKKKHYDLADQISRSSKAIPALIAESYAKRHQKKNFKKYLDDGMGEANETIVHLSFTKDLKYPNPSLCDDLIDAYNIIGKQLYKLGNSWLKMKR